MRLSVAILALSTLAAAGPLPPMSNTTIDLGLLTQAPANFTLNNVDPITTMNNLKAIYDYLNKTDHSGVVVSGFKGGDFWTWLRYTFEDPYPPPPSGLHARSPSDSTPFTKRLDSQDAAALKKLKTLYDDSQKNGKRAEEGAGVEKRGWFWHWVKMTFESPGLGSGS